MERLLLTGNWKDLSTLVSILCPIDLIDIMEKNVPDELVFTGLILFFTKAVIENNIPVFILPVRIVAGFILLFILFFFLKEESGSATRSSAPFCPSYSGLTVSW